MLTLKDCPVWHHTCARQHWLTALALQDCTRKCWEHVRQGGPGRLARETEKAKLGYGCSCGTSLIQRLSGVGRCCQVTSLYTAAACCCSRALQDDKVGPIMLSQQVPATAAASPCMHAHNHHPHHTISSMPDNCGSLWRNSSCTPSNCRRRQQNMLAYKATLPSQYRQPAHAFNPALGAPPTTSVCRAVLQACVRHLPVRQLSCPAIDIQANTAHNW